jgi:hypothetical protein
VAAVATVLDGQVGVEIPAEGPPAGDVRVILFGSSGGDETGV